MKSESPDLWVRIPRHRGPKSWSKIEDQVVPLERHTHFLAYCGKDSSRKFYWNLDGKFPTENALVLIENKVYSYLYMWMTS